MGYTLENVKAKRTGSLKQEAERKGYAATAWKLGIGEPTLTHKPQYERGKLRLE